MLEQAFEALKSYDWGTDPKVLSPIDEAIVTTHGDATARDGLESRLTALLETGAVSRAARDYICRKLRVIGTAACVPALAKLLLQKDDSHMARYALERIPAPEAADAMRQALQQLSGPLLVGAIGSLGVRRDAKSVPALAALLSDRDTNVARAAAFALGDIGTAEAAQTLEQTRPTTPVRPAVTDAALACAEQLLANGKQAEALAVYKGFAGEDQPKHVRLAATRGMLECATKRE